MHLHRRLGAAENGLGEYRQAQTDGGATQRVDHVVQFHPERLAGVELACSIDHAFGEFGMDAPVAVLVGFGQGGTPHRLAQAHVIELSGLGRETPLGRECSPVRSAERKPLRGTPRRTAVSESGGCLDSAAGCGGRSSMVASP